MSHDIRVVVWNEFRHEKNDLKVKAIYPDGIHAALARNLGTQSGITVKTAVLDEPEHGLTEEVLKTTDVLLWWGHLAHDDVRDEVALRVQRHILEGMGLIVLHSAHASKIFKMLMGTSCCLKWREADEKQRLWNIEPSHPITEGIGEYIELPQEEMYGERFDIPDPDKLIFISWFPGGEVFRSGCTWQRGHGRIFYFQPGHEMYPTYYNEQVLRVIGNAVRWARRRVTIPYSCPNVAPLELLPSIK